MQKRSSLTRRRLLVRSAGFAAIAVAAPLLAACAETSTSGAEESTTLASLKEQGYVRLGITGSVPYGYTDKDGRVTGEAPEVARAVFEKLGVSEIRATQVAFDQLIPALNAGQFDVVAVGMYITPERCKNALFSRPDYVMQEAFLVPKGNPNNIRTYKDIAEKNLKLGMQGGGVQAKYAKEAGVPDSHVVTYEGKSQYVQAVVTGRVDAFGSAELTMTEILKQFSGEPIEATPSFLPILDGKPVNTAAGFVFRQGSDELVEAFDKEHLALQRNGEWLSIVEPFGFKKSNLPPDNLTTKQLCDAR